MKWKEILQNIKTCHYGHLAKQFMGNILQLPCISTPNQAAKLRKEEIIGSLLRRAVMSVNCWLWRGLCSSFHPYPLFVISSELLQCCSHPLPLPLPSFTLWFHTDFRPCEAQNLFLGDSHSISGFLFCLYLFIFNLASTHRVLCTILDKYGKWASRRHCCKGLILLACHIIKPTVLLAKFLN